MSNPTIWRCWRMVRRVPLESRDLDPWIRLEKGSIIYKYKNILVLEYQIDLRTINKYILFSYNLIKIAVENQWISEENHRFLIAKSSANGPVSSIFSSYVKEREGKFYISIPFNSIYKKTISILSIPYINTISNHLKFDISIS